MRKLFNKLKSFTAKSLKAAVTLQKGSLLLLLFVLAVMFGQNYPTLAQVQSSEVSNLSPAFNANTNTRNLLLGTPNKDALKALYGSECVQDGLIGQSMLSLQEIMSPFAYDEETGFTGTSQQLCIIQEAELPLEEQLSLFYGKPGSTGGINNILSRIEATLLEQQPSSAMVFAQDQVNRFVNAGAVYAQEETPNNAPTQAYFPGTGLDMLRPVQNLWGWAVTASYSALVIVILVVAIALALGDRVPGAQKITLNNAIQGIVVAMILIPLSYPIAGLFVDLTTLGANTVHGILFRGGGVASSVLDEYREETLLNGRDLYADDPNINIFNINSRIGIDEVFYSARSSFFNDLECQVTRDVEGNCGQAATGIFGVANGILNLIAGPEVSIGNLFIGLIFTLLNFAMLLTGLKFGWFLFTKFIFILFAPVIMPFSFLTLALPGNISKTAFNTVKQLAATSACFLAAYSMVLVAIMFSSSSFFATNLPTNDIGSGYNYTPPLFGGLQNVLLGGGSGLGGAVVDGATSNASISLILAVIGIAVYFGIPSTLEKIYKAIAPEVQFPLADFAKSSFGELSTSFRLSGRGARKVTALGYQATAGTVGRLAGAGIRGAMNEKDASGRTRYQRWFGDRLQRGVDQANLSSAGGNVLTRARAGLMNSARQAVGNTAGRALTGSQDDFVVNRNLADISKADAELELDVKSPTDVYVEGQNIVVTESAILSTFSAVLSRAGSDTWDMVTSTSPYMAIDLVLKFKSVKDKEKPLLSGELKFDEKPDTVVGVFTGGDPASSNKFGAITISRAKQTFLISSNGSVDVPVKLNLSSKYFIDKYGLVNRAQSMSKQIKVTITNKNKSTLEKTFSISLEIRKSSKINER